MNWPIPTFEEQLSRKVTDIANAFSSAKSRLLKEGNTARSVIIVDVGLAGICTLIVCKAHRHAIIAMHTNTRGHPPANFENYTF